jgi:hypothetical protein
VGANTRIALGQSCPVRDRDGTVVSGLRRAFKPDKRIASKIFSSLDKADSSGNYEQPTNNRY